MDQHRNTRRGLLGAAMAAPAALTLPVLAGTSAPETRRPFQAWWDAYRQARSDMDTNFADRSEAELASQWAVMEHYDDLIRDTPCDSLEAARVKLESALLMFEMGERSDESDERIIREAVAYLAQPGTR